MSTAAQIIAVVIAATVFVTRLVTALYHARVDDRIAARHARPRAAAVSPLSTHAARELGRHRHAAPDAFDEPGGGG
jgi:hypothetical protein